MNGWQKDEDVRLVPWCRSGVCFSFVEPNNRN